jgi:hypothetical protein
MMKNISLEVLKEQKQMRNADLAKIEQALKKAESLKAEADRMIDEGINNANAIAGSIQQIDKLIALIEGEPTVPEEKANQHDF